MRGRTFSITGKEAPSLLITAWRDRLVSSENNTRTGALAAWRGL